MSRQVGYPIALVGAALAMAVAASLGALPALLGLVMAAGVLVISAQLALERPELWLAMYITVLLVVPDPHFGIAGVPVGVNGSDPMFMGALPSLILRPAGSRTAVTRSALLFLAWAGLTLVPAWMLSGPVVAAGSALRWVRLTETLFPLFFVFQRITDPLRALEICTPVFLVSATLASAYGVAQFFLGFDLSYLGIQYTQQYLSIEGGTRQRAIGLFYEANGFGSMAALLVWVSLFFWASSGVSRGWVRFGLLVAIPLGVSAILLSFARSAVLALVGTAVVGALLGGRLGVRRISVAIRAVLALGVGALGVVIVAGKWVWPFLESRVLPALALFSGVTSSQLAGLTSKRTETWPILLQRFWDSGPLFRLTGIGYKSLTFSSLADQGGTVPLIGDSQFITTLIEQGIVGLLLLMVLATSIASQLWQAARQRDGLTAHWARLLALYWIAQVLFVFPVLDYLAIFRLVPIVMAFVALVVADQPRNAVINRSARSVGLQAVEKSPVKELIL